MAFLALFYLTLIIEQTENIRLFTSKDSKTTAENKEKRIRCDTHTCEKVYGFILISRYI